MVGICSRHTLATTTKITISNGCVFPPFDLTVFIRLPSSAYLHPLTFIHSPSSSFFCRPSFVCLHPPFVANLSPSSVHHHPPFIAVLCCHLSFFCCHSCIPCCHLPISRFVLCCHSCSSLQFCVFRCQSMSFVYNVFILISLHESNL
jgi:hypothetical protein